MIKKVLIATDGSEHARKAVVFGADIAGKYDAEVILLNVLLRNEVSQDLMRMVRIEHLTDEGGKLLSESISGVPAGKFPAFVAMTQDPSAPAERMLMAVGMQILDHAEDLAAERGANRISKRIEDGKPVDCILKVAESEGVDLIVSGARGLSGLAALVLGSTSQRLSQLSPVTCMTVR